MCACKHVRAIWWASDWQFLNRVFLKHQATTDFTLQTLAWPCDSDRRHSLPSCSDAVLQNMAT